MPRSCDQGIQIAKNILPWIKIIGIRTWKTTSGNVLGKLLSKANSDWIFLLICWNHLVFYRAKYILLLWKPDNSICNNLNNGWYNTRIYNEILVCTLIEMCAVFIWYIIIYHGLSYLLPISISLGHFGPGKFGAILSLLQMVFSYKAEMVNRQKVIGHIKLKEITSNVIMISMCIKIS